MSTHPHTPEPVSPWTPLERPLNLRETVLEQLRTAIITGRLAEGEVVSAPSLGQALGVSATPVREAMMDLAREGLVETIKNKGFRVTRMSPSDLQDLTQIRLLLEPPAMQYVVGNIPAEIRAELDALAAECVRAAEREDLEEYLRTDREFHALLLARTGNPQLVELATSLRTRTRLYGIATLAREGKLGDSAREHQRLLEVLGEDDGDAAEALLREHIGHASSLWATGESASATDATGTSDGSTVT
ncbi:DNA-binding GntR family transcriptional regulator [Leucobacter luti]|uniref:DNA-binding GntR family transcriptional regulator n=1 Tax=Leucobacter luti TaxID=340320 RepID=A0A4R6S4Z5_9MICO|nr:GntR family transcriptional regulator [Leucobacter luti]TDP94393.1 DNA-binding GntR family transcriptional regulator [Leucobacter luti]